MIRISTFFAAPALLALAACQTYSPGAASSGGSYGDVSGPSAESMVLEIQQRLNAQGYNAGPEDGILGPRTHSAIQVFQADHALLPDGVADEDLVQRLRSSAGGERRGAEPAQGGGGWIDPSV